MRRDEQGQVTLLIIGFASILLMAIVVVIDASAAYLQRQGLDTLADGAALHGADLGSTRIYQEGLTAERLSQQEETVHAAVRAYLRDAGAGERYADIRVAVEVDAAGRSVTVRLEAPLHLPLTITRATVSDLILTMIYGFWLTLLVVVFIIWQTRGKREKAQSNVRRSSFGRPLARRG